MVVNVYERFYQAEAVFSDVPRKAALVMLTSDSEAGQIAYRAAVTFFPHRDEEDIAVSYDACFAKELYSTPGRRSKKREQQFLEVFRGEIDALAEGAGGAVLWEQPLGEARMG